MSKAAVSQERERMSSFDNTSLGSGDKSRDGHRRLPGMIATDSKDGSRTILGDINDVRDRTNGITVRCDFVFNKTFSSYISLDFRVDYMIGDVQQPAADLYMRMDRNALDGDIICTRYADLDEERKAELRMRFGLTKQGAQEMELMIKLNVLTLNFNGRKWTGNLYTFQDFGSQQSAIEALRFLFSCPRNFHVVLLGEDSFEITRTMNEDMNKQRENDPLLNFYPGNSLSFEPSVHRHGLSTPKTRPPLTPRLLLSFPDWNTYVTVESEAHLQELQQLRENAQITEDDARHQLNILRGLQQNQDRSLQKILLANDFTEVKGTDLYASVPGSGTQKTSILDQIINRAGIVLDEQQQDALKACRNIRRVVLFDGPSSTGKTVVALLAIQPLLRSRKADGTKHQVLIFADTPTDVDHLAETVLALTSQYRAPNDPAMIVRWTALTAEQEFIKDQVDVIILTPGHAADVKSYMGSFTASAILLEDAGTFTDGALWAASLFGECPIIMIGDSRCSLPNVFSDRWSNEFHRQLDLSVFARLRQMGCPAISFGTQYRSASIICDCISSIWCPLARVNGTDQRQGVVEVYEFIQKNYGINSAMVFLTVPNGSCRLVENSTTKFNEVQASLALATLERLIRTGQFAPRDIGITTTYTGQTTVLKKGIRLLANTMHFNFEDVRVSALDGFRGLMRRVIIVVTTVGNDLGYLVSTPHIDFGISRATDGVIIIGSIRQLCNADRYKQTKLCELVNFCQKQKIVLQMDRYDTPEKFKAIMPPAAAPPPSNPRVCSNCKRAGHHVSACPELKPRNDEAKTCKNCGVVGHIRKDCPQPRQEGRACRRCHKRGHLQAECPENL